MYAVRPEEGGDAGGVDEVVLVVLVAAATGAVVVGQERRDVAEEAIRGGCRELGEYRWRASAIP